MVLDTSHANLNALEFEVFGVDSRTGFMPLRPPVGRLPALWEVWEELLDDARHEHLQPGDKFGLSVAEMARSERWRNSLCQIPLLPIDDLETSQELLRRAHLVLSFLMHFYIHTLPPDSPVVIPQPISIPLLQVAKVLDLPPVITFSDTVLYNWCLTVSSSDTNPPKSLNPDAIRCQTLFTDTPDESAFYLCSARIELHGVRALNIMRSSMDEIFVGDALAVARLTTYLISLSTIIGELKSLLLDVRKECDPEIYYNVVRPWFRGEDSDTYLVPGSGQKRRWIFEGARDYTDLNMLPPDRELSGASAGQSSLIHALDVFLGINHERPNSLSFMKRMQRYMPRQHRQFLDHLAKNPRPLREFVMSASSMDPNDGALALKEAYNHVVMSLKEFRDSHMIIATLYIMGPARRAAAVAATSLVTPISKTEAQAGPKVSNTVQTVPEATHTQVTDDATVGITGTGGTDLVEFLKGVRNQTIRTLLSDK
ncbi:Indoleamine 2,3-dioxygenase [Lentinula lateritia]|uniref:Indoleamine 2,3-dioxygenase n=1 Tax=Lentinula lateritia TaxID=40482 RepID=A0ABQ8VBW2_9AGAR|nr:Indoleamine 2,3-dioxygenase [Lentinula lateritia]